jgi:dihydroorotate dehydrogenase
MYKALIRPLLFSFSPEKVHHFTFSFVRLIHNIPGKRWALRQFFAPTNQSWEKQVMGLRFKNPVGLAAGFDKDGKAYKELASFGFGFIEVGTVTPRPQPGNPQPRLFRLPADKGLINRMGFNNEGVEALVRRLKKRKSGDLVIGGNIGKNKTTPNDRATEDYQTCFRALFPYVDYFVVNVSSPNTPNLRDLQDKEPLTQLLQTLQNENKEKDFPKPILLKIAPDLTDGQIKDIIEIVGETDIAGVIATNTTISRENLRTGSQRVENIGAGGLSGAPVRQRSTQVIQALREGIGPEKCIIGVGGIFTARDAKEKLNAGADLVQVYTGFIYEGPAMVKRILKGL